MLQILLIFVTLYNISCMTDSDGLIHQILIVKCYAKIRQLCFYHIVTDSKLDGLPAQIFFIRFQRRQCFFSGHTRHIQLVNADAFQNRLSCSADCHGACHGKQTDGQEKASFPFFHNLSSSSYIA